MSETGHSGRDQEIVDQFIAELKELRKAAGSPSIRKISKGAHRDRSTVGALFKGKDLPSAEFMLAIVEYLGGRPDEWKQRCEIAKNAHQRCKERQRQQETGAGRLQSWTWPWRRVVIVTVVTAVIGSVIAGTVNTIFDIVISDSGRASTGAPGNQRPPMDVVGTLHCAQVTEDTFLYDSPNERSDVRRKRRGNWVTYDDKYRDRKVGKVVFRAVRTPNDEVRYHWMKAAHLKEIPCP